MVKIIILLLMLSPLLARAAESFSYPVFRDRGARKEPGKLEISEAGIIFRSDLKNTLIDIPLANVYKADVSHPKIIRVETFDTVKRRLMGRQVHVFRLREGEHNEALSRFLAGTVQRPVVGSYGAPSEADTRIRAYHRHRMGGCHGIVHIDANGIRFLSKRSQDSRTWQYRDLETVGTMNAFHLRVSTLAETYNFDLKERLPQAVYDAVSQRIYQLPGHE